MCGIAGIVNFAPDQAVDEERLRRMRDTLRHRGPDGEGLFIEGSVGLGHRRLAIVDLSSGGQPMANEDGTILVVCNGEIYNHPELRPMLQARGHRYRTRSDTETILHLYEEEGERCVERLRGMFAFALWDRRRRRLLLARDRLGIKPLYYARTGHGLLFASEIKAILQAAPFPAEMNEAILPEFLANRFVSGDETFFKGVSKLLPGRTLTWSLDQGVRERRFWSPPVESPAPGAGPGDAAEDLRERLREVVRLHLMSDVPVGVFLSGGLDSSGLLGLMASQVSAPVRSFSVGFSESEANELPYARLAADSAGAEHRDISVSARQFFAALPRLVWHEDEPIAFPSSVPLYFVSRLAAEHVKVVLTGEGADELFLGYNRYRVAAWNERLAAAWAALLPGGARGAIGRGVESLPPALRRYARRTFLALPPGARSHVFENFAVFPEAAQRRLFPDAGRSGRRDPYASVLPLYEQAPGDPPARMGHADLQTYLVELLMKQDQMSMAASIESRVPFLDHELVEHVAALPRNLKLRGLKTKAILREALRDLVPRPILTRRKMGFPVPVGGWLRGPFRPLLQEFVLGARALSRGRFDPSFLQRLVAEHVAGTANHGDRLWLLLNLEIWQRVFVEGQDPASLAPPGSRPSQGRRARAMEGGVSHVDAEARAQ
jgi:asparagine synthase (glutamine-hydrolysing)